MIPLPDSMDWRSAKGYSNLRPIGCLPLWIYYAEDHGLMFSTDQVYAEIMMTMWHDNCSVNFG